jgi:predicted 2-oxoglutarate/Fe(II)-dependent dioxygenase YbiX
MGLWGRIVTDGGIQIANYNIKDKKQGAWHHDSSADISVVVPLNTGDYEGGGTEFHGRGIVDPLPTGSALMFPSFTHMHRGLPVKSGDRYLLVFWLVSLPSWVDKKTYLQMNFV